MSEQTIQGWFTGRVPKEWFSVAPEVTVDREEILVVGDLEDVEVDKGADHEAARAGRIKGFREDTREARMRIADEAERRFRRKVSWGAQIGDHRELFTTASVPVMTRLRMRDRKTLDTLVEAGIARSRSEALAWCVRLVGEKQAEWLGELQQALQHVSKARAAGPVV